MTTGKSLLRVLSGESLAAPPVWLMRQAGRYLPEYLATRAQAGSFLDLCYSPQLAAEVTLQPIRRFGFDAAILFADILLVPHGLGRKLWFETGEGPRLEPMTTMEEVERLADVAAMHEFLAPVYETVRILRGALPKETTLIGFAGAPWTVATYMIAGRGKDQQAGALALMRGAPEVFSALMARLETATTAYLIAQIDAGAEVVKLFDSWAGALAPNPAVFQRWCVDPAERIAAAVRAARPGAPVILFPRGAGELYADMARGTGAQALAIDEGVSATWARDALQPHVAVQGNLDARHMVTGGAALDDAARGLLSTLGGGPFIFNLGHGITPDADPANVERLLRVIRG
ncbi:uroporphyrinogen decarboxylase [Rubrimonas cliftonensis]|uniref:Uroporphyrinogen decarboxylase n=1 Tax=Rubrimonas cliftonensis TaxID=89524 RepID=A0A1H4EG06_9RHOB|nr:uroporphyrinogen decarboxylase [Rubrimonas cliftonensis]SEA83182.1 uroporphyrinogen decarboxylase [Rubrimonas cliftonensis]